MTVRQTVFAPSTATLAVEEHNGSIWLCRLEHGHSQLLARFSSPAAVDDYKRLVTLRDRHMHEAGRSGL